MTYRAWNTKTVDRAALKELTAAIAQQNTEELEYQNMDEEWSEEKYRSVLAAQQKEAGLLAGILAARGITDPAEALTLLAGEEELSVKAAYPQMSFKYEVEGSENCNKIKELSLKQMTLQSNINGLVKDPNIGNDSIESIVGRMLQAYKQDIKTNYIFKEPMKAYAYYALFQTVQLGNVNTLIFNPRNNKDDVKVFAAVATSWDTYYPGAERGKNLHNIAIEGMKDIRIIENQMAQQQIEASKVSVNGCIELALQDNKGQVRRLSDLKGKVVLLDFHLFASKESTKRIMMLRELYNKYHAAGLEIYQVSVDPDEHFWKTSTAAIPWICVRDEDGIQGKSLALYNVQSIPTFFLIDRTNTLQARDAQIKDIEAAIKNLL